MELQEGEDEAKYNDRCLNSLTTIANNYKDIKTKKY
jgi:hypothetical protein